MAKIYQAFLSSTYRDLQKERQAAVNALVGVRCLPVGMGINPASGEDAWPKIKKLIDDSDFDDIIIGGRYGSICPGGNVSWTETEYRYAESVDHTPFAFIRDDAKPDSDHQGRLAAFKAHVGNRWNSHWSGRPEALGGQISSARSHYERALRLNEHYQPAASGLASLAA